MRIISVISSIVLLIAVYLVLGLVHFLAITTLTVAVFTIIYIQVLKQKKQASRYERLYIEDLCQTKPVWAKQAQ